MRSKQSLGFNNQLGFLGPIGDDLPSLIPLILALVIFFSVFTFSFNVFSSKNSDFKADLETLSISRVLVSNGYLSSYGDFEELCNSITVTDIRFKAMVTDQYIVAAENAAEFPPTLDDMINNRHIFSTEGECEYPDEDDCGEFLCRNYTNIAVEDRLEDPRTNVITKVKPVVAEHDKKAKPMHLVVIAWK